MRSVFATLYSEKYSLKSQLLVTWSTVAVLTSSLTLMICYSMLFSMAKDTYFTAKSTLVGQTYSNLKADANEIAATINKQLSLIGQSVSMVGALYSQSLVQHNAAGEFSPERVYREYNFLQPPNTIPTYPTVPQDYGSLAGRSRFPTNLAGFQFGSLLSTSVYLYNKAAGSAQRTDSSWSSTVASDPNIGATISNLGYQDLDLQSQFVHGPNTTVMFYVAAKIPTSPASNLYNCVLRTFPGILKSNSSYDPSLRGWFTHAPVGAYYLQGPYQETFTKQAVLTLSSMRTVTMPSGQSSVTANLVVAAVMLLDDIRQIVKNINYPNLGFGAIIKASTLEVIAWKDLETFTSSGTFLTLSDIDPNLAAVYTPDSTFTYNDASGASWFVLTVSFFASTDGASGNKVTNALSMLVFARRDMAEMPLASLNDNITSTTNYVTIETIIIIYGICAGILLVVYFAVRYVTQPLDYMRRISKEIIKMAAEEEETRDYAPIVNQSSNFNFDRSDEVGVLCNNYFSIVTLLHNNNVKKKEKPKYPNNPFYLEQLAGSSYEGLKWSNFYSCYKEFHREEGQGVGSNAREGEPAKAGATDDLDVLGSLNAGKRGVVGGFVPVQTVDVDAHPIDIDTRATHAGTGVREVEVEMSPLKRSDSVQSSSRLISHSKTEIPKVTATTLCEVELPDRQPSWWSSVKSKFYALATFTILGVLTIMVITVVQLKAEGTSWMTKNEVILMATQMQNLAAVAYIKANFVKTYFQQISLDVYTTAVQVEAVLNKNISNPSFLNASHTPYLQSPFLSYSLDPANTHAHPAFSAIPHSTSDLTYLPNNLFSGYFYKNDVGCALSGEAACNITYNSTINRLSGLADVKFTSLFHPQSVVSYVQLGLQQPLAGFVREFPYPYAGEPTWASPSSCQVASTTTTHCQNLYTSSKCANPSMASYPPYDPLCRSWYNLAMNPPSPYSSPQPRKVFFQLPRVSSSGKYVITAVAALSALDGSIFGVLNFNVLVSQLSQAINRLRLLSSGYVFLVDSTAATSIVLHPYAAPGCYAVSCAEATNGMNAAEFTAFNATVLTPIQINTLTGTSLTVATSYQKGGKEWRLSYSPVDFGTFRYTLIATVPMQDILASSLVITEKINKIVINMIVAFVISIFFFAFIIRYSTLKLVSHVVEPFDDLNRVCRAINNDNDLSQETRINPTSLDLKILMDAFSKLMIALRFGSESYARGDRGRAHKVFTDALQLYLTTHNARGIGASHNNLGAVEMSMKNFGVAEVHYNEAIRNAEEMVANAAPGSAELARANRILSDRKGNKALLYLEQQCFDKAYDILEAQIKEDAAIGFIRGNIVKQGTLGQYYLKQGEVKSAERVFLSALEFIRRKDESLFNAQWNRLETAAAEQIALYNIASLRAAQGDASATEAAYLEALSLPVSMHTASATNTLAALLGLLQSQKRDSEAAELLSLAKLCDFSIDKSGGGSGGIKRVVFVLDYSGSMSGSKIKSASENLALVFKDHISNDDYVSLIHFSHRVVTDFPLTAKSSDADGMAAKIHSLVHPTGSTAFFDAVVSALHALQADKHGASGNDWIIALTDGEDTSSEVKLQDLLNMLGKPSTSGINIIVIGVGPDVHVDELSSIAKATPKGVYIFADGNKDSITQAFGKVATLIQGQVILEEM